MKKLINRLFWILLAGSIFAWSNFFYEVYLYLNNEVSAVSCSSFQPGVELPNPLVTPCFYGAIVFLLAFFHIIALKKMILKK